jgi:hypothetical protein
VKGIGREGGVSEEEKNCNQLMVVEYVVGRIDTGEIPEPVLPITACRELHSTRRTEPVSQRTRRLATLTPAQSVVELFATEANMEEWIRKEYADLFKEPEGLPPHRPRFGDFRIRLLPGSKAPYRTPYRLTPAEWDEYKRQIKLYGDKGYIRRSRSPYAAPVLFVPKPGGAPGELRMVIDYRALNAITVKDRFPLPLPEELIDKLHGKTFFSKMDFWSGYSQNRVASEDIEKTAFVGPDGLWEWLVIPQGIATAPPWFMRMVSELLAPHKAYCVVFIDDILIFSSTQDEHERHVRAVLDTLRKQGFRLKDKKCQFGKAESEFVGFRVDGAGVRLMEDKIKSIAEWPMIKSPKEARIFLGLTGAYRKFVPGFAIKAMGLFTVVNMSKAEFDRHMEDTENVREIEKAMTEVKEIMAAEPCLALPESDNCEFLLRTDASDFGIGATLRQKQGQSYEERILAYFSRKLHGAETRYSTYDKELLAIRDALKHWRYYLLGRHTTISTDHASLRHMLSQPKLSQRQMRALEDMMEYDFDVEYLPGAKNYVQDALSRRPDYKEPPLPRFQSERKLRTSPTAEDSEKLVKSTIEEEELFELAIEDGVEWLHSIRKGYLADPYCSDVLSYLEPEGSTSREKGTPAEERQRRADLRRQSARGRHYHLDDGLIIHNSSGCLVIPQEKDIKQRILQEAHDAAVGGHFGITRTYETISRRFFWPRMYQEVKRYVQGCATCARTKSSNQKPYGLLQPLDIPDERWRRINIDFITKLPTTQDGNDTIITIIDALTKRAHWIATKEKDLTAVRFAEIFRDHHVRYHGLPDAIVSDRDVRFTSTFWKTLMSEFDTKLRLSTAFHPQTDGQAEKANSIVERYLRAYSAERQNKWDQQLALAEFAYNATRQKSIEMSPFEADLSYIPRMPLDALASIGTERRYSLRARPGRRTLTADSDSDGRTFAAEMVNTLSRLRQTLQHAQEQQIAEANKHRQPHTFQQGDKVLLSAKNLPITYATATDNHRKALHQKYIGEFELGRQRGENAFEVLLPAHWKLARTQNVAALKPSMIDHSRPQAPAPALRVTRARRGADGVAQAEYGVEAIRSWRRNPDQGGRIEYEVKFEDDDELSWEPAEMFDGGGKEILEEFQAADEELKRELAVKTTKQAQEKAQEKAQGRPRKRRKRQAWVMEVEDGADITVFEAEDWEDWED